MKEDIDELVAALSALIAQQQAVANLAASLQRHAVAPDAGSCPRTGARSALLQSSLLRLNREWAGRAAVVSQLLL